MWASRGEVEILMDVLSACLKGARVTHLMYRANLRAQEGPRSEGSSH